ncbi:hypothetical protein BFG06_09915 [Aeromonas caviae]|nr:hypothetical protein BFG06_09915 [Aeromonas caviae]
MVLAGSSPFWQRTAYPRLELGEHDPGQDEAVHRLHPGDQLHPQRCWAKSVGREGMIRGLARFSAVRMVKPDAGHLTLRRLGTLGFGLYGTGAYLPGCPQPRAGCRQLRSG